MRPGCVGVECPAFVADKRTENWVETIHEVIYCDTGYGIRGFAGSERYILL